MERGVVIGGMLISASFLFAVLLNRSAEDSPGPAAGAISGPASGLLCCTSGRQGRSKDCPVGNSGDVESPSGLNGCAGIDLEADELPGSSGRAAAKPRREAG